MSGPSRLPLEALKHASRAIGSAVSPSLIKPAPSPGSTNSGATSSQPFLRSQATAANASSPLVEPKRKEKEKQEQKKKQKKAKTPKWRGVGELGDLMHLPVLLSPVRIPRNPIVLCHGLYGFDVRGPFLGLEIHYWAAVMDILNKKLGAEVIIRGVPGTGSIQSRAEALHQFLCSAEAGVRGKDLNIVGHSMGGLDARHLISNIRPAPEQYRPVSLTTICTPHRGSPFMDWCNANIGIGNEAIEEALREVKAENRDGNLGSVETDDYQPPPYSLKSPLFVRASKKSTNGTKAPLEDGDEKATTKEEQDATTEKILNRAGRSTSDSGFSMANAEGDTTPLSSKEVSIADKIKKSKEPDSKTSAILDSIGSAFSSLTGQLSDYMLSLLDTPAYAMLSTKYMNKVFNPSTPDDPNVKYYSIAARTRSIPIWHPLWLPKLILDAAAESRTSGGEADGSGDALGGRMQGNDGLVSVQSAQWGEFLGIVDGCDHWDLRGGGGPRLAEGKVKQEVDSTLEKAKSSAEEAKSWIDVNQLLGLWRAIRPSSSDKARADTESRTGPDAVPNAQHLSTLSVAQQEHIQQQKEDEKQEDVQTADSLESQQPGAALSQYPTVEQSKNVDPIPVATAASQLHDSDAQADSVSDIVQTFMHAYSHLADPQHEESDYDWTAAPSFTPTSDQESIITEIAQWISERLPQRDEGRRAEAEKEAAAQDQELEAHEHEHEQAISALSASKVAAGAPPSPVVDSTVEKKTIPLQSILPSQVMSGASLATSLESSKSAPLPQYRIRHKDEEEDEDPAEREKEAGLVKDVEELELFWLAVCHHLWARGF
ncbi:hypothetical protein OC846_006040 [Tilletia horrida]|uniref:DUF676 domain-containing protein n=1 Tax=Tilletia horrida TaxID=155126 RepID=A0AAN6GKM5_9BASI|nr:hypothetical protein OC846_006040 [Tilletia horrida]